MNDLIQALMILREYLEDKNALCATHCEHDILTVIGVDPSDVSAQHIDLLDRLGFFVYDEEYFASYRFGSA